ncbi:unnamed protein product [Gadus morhua 'NCC']
MVEVEEVEVEVEEEDQLNSNTPRHGGGGGGGGGGRLAHRNVSVSELYTHCSSCTPVFGLARPAPELRVPHDGAGTPGDARGPLSPTPSIRGSLCRTAPPPLVLILPSLSEGVCA